MFIYPNKDFEERDFDIKKDINTFIKKLKKIRKKIKNGEKIKFEEEELYTVHNSDKLRELLKQIIIKDNSPINKLIENSQFSAERIFVEISKLNLKNEIQYKNLEVNILKDYVRTKNYFCLIKNKEGDNNDKIEKSIFNFENLNQIFLNEYLSNLKGIISDNSYIEKNRKILIFK